MSEYVLGSDEGLIPTVRLECLSHYQNGDHEYVDLCLSDSGYKTLKAYFFALYEAEKSADEK